MQKLFSDQFNSCFRSMKKQCSVAKTLTCLTIREYLLKKRFTPFSRVRSPFLLRRDFGERGSVFSFHEKRSDNRAYEKDFPQENSTMTPVSTRTCTSRPRVKDAGDTSFLSLQSPWMIRSSL